MIDRRSLLHITTGLAATAALMPGAVRAAKAATPVPDDTPLPPVDARTARLLWARLVGDLSGRTVFFFTHGTVWGFKPQADDLTVKDFARRIYGYSGVAARKFQRQADGTYSIRQKAWSFYRDPVTDKITDQIPNPYTGVTDTAAPMSGPQSQRVLDLSANPDGSMPFGMRIRRFNKTGIIETSSFQRINPGGISWYKLEGNIEDYICDRAVLDNADATHIPSHFNQNLIAEWQTWTKMHGTPGHILFKGNGEPVYSLDQVPGDQIAAIEKFFPGTMAEVRAWK